MNKIPWREDYCWLANIKLSVFVWNWILWNLTKFQLIHPIQTIVIFILSIGCLIELKFCEVSRNSISNWIWKFQLSILKDKKVLFLKIIFFWPLSIPKQKSFVYWLNFLDGFGSIHPLYYGNLSTWNFNCDKPLWQSWWRKCEFFSRFLINCGS